MASLEDIQELLDGAEVLAAGRTLGLTDEEAITTKRAAQMRQKREQQRANRARGGSNEGNTLYGDDERIREIDAQERSFQRDKPIREADLLGMAEYGSNEADLQQVSSGRIESIKQVDASGIGADERGAKKFNRARRDLLPQQVRALIERDSGKPELVEGVNFPGERVHPLLREATILQELGLSVPEREDVPYQTSKSGQRRRNFGYVQKDADGNVIKEKMRRVRTARPSGQPLDPSTIISEDKYPTARRNRERGIGDDGPTGAEAQTAPVASNAPLKDAYVRLATAVQNGDVGLDDPAGNGRTVREVLVRLEDSIGERGRSDLIKGEAKRTQIADTKSQRQRARRQLREFAIAAKAEGNPLSKSEAQALLVRLQNPKEVSDLKAEREALRYIGSQGSTDEVIGETVMSDDAWKSKSTKTIPSLPVMSEAQKISDMQVFQRVNPQGEVVGHSAGGHFIGEANTPTTFQNLNVPQNQQSLINFISENLQYDSQGGLKPAIITTATQDFTDAARGLTKAAFGEGVENIPSGIHSLAEAQSFMDRLIERRTETGKGFSRYNPENPAKPIKVPAGETPTVSDLMSTMDVDRATQGRLANALYQMALAEGSAVNQEGKQTYGAREGSYQRVYRPEGGSGSVNLELQRAGTPAVNLPKQNIIFDSPAGFFYDGADAQYIHNSKRQVIDGENVNIQAALRGLSDELAREPFIGAVAGEPVAKQRYRKGFGPNVSLEEGYTELEKSMAKGSRKYSQAKVDANVALARAVEERHARSMGDKRAVELGVLAQSHAADDRLYAERVEDLQRYNRRRTETLGALANRGQVPTPGQRTRPAAVAPSIASTPGTPTGNQAAPINDAGAPGALAVISQERAARQQPSRYYDGSSKYDVTTDFENTYTKRVPQSMRDELDQLTPKSKVMGYMSDPDGPSSESMPRRERRNVVKRLQRENVRNRAAIGGAGLGVLAGVLGLSNIGREDEEEERRY